MYHNAGRGILRLYKNVISAEVCFMNIFVGSFHLEEVLVKFVRFMPCTLFLILISHSVQI